MRGFVALAVIIAAIAVLVLFGGNETILGLRPDLIASLAWLGAVGILAFGWVVQHFRGQWTRALEAIAFWMAMIVMLVAVYSYRFELQGFANRLLGEVAPGYTVTLAGGEVQVARHAGGSFVIDGAVDGVPTRFILDTGASAVVLTSEAAARAGIDPATLFYTQPVMTANGRTMAASTTLGELTVGNITERRVPALVAREGSLSQNLLGMTFLDRLASFEVRGDRLVLRGRGG
ncbi:MULTISPECIES: TIGR02281 family clan AA aspartic protease, partial [unclassified Chelatococcus]|uniref:retropepsin-like aspartic protease family protein n=1 Tax=unclassified Chelatococcus TaxID=2638111 RepID=UPI00036662D2